MYEFGWGVSIDNIEAVKWYLKSAEQGNLDGQRRLGLMYKSGKVKKKVLNKLSMKQ